MDRFELRYADYSLSSDQEAVRDTFGEFFANECPTERVRAAEPLGYDEKLWRKLADLGAASMGLPEPAGGDGAGLVELLLVAEEAGAALAPVPFIEHAAASRALAGAPGAPAELVADAAGGRRIVTEEVLEEERRTGSGFNERVHLALGQRGWITPTWPAERGGAGLDPVRARMLELEMRRAGVPSITQGTTGLVLAAVEKFGQPDLAADLLPGVAAGTVRFCLGYTEPDGGSDIAAAKTRAVRDGDEWVINGSKIFTTGAQNCQYTFLITRTDPELPKHRGLTMFLVPLASQGVEIQAIRTFGGERTNIVYYSDVRISDRYRLGGVNDGWSVLHGPLDEEHGVGRDGASGRLGDLSIGSSFLQTLGRAIDSAVAWACTTTRADGSRPADDRMVRYRLGAVAMHMEAGLVTPGPMGRVKGSDALVRGAAELMDLTGPASLLSEGSPGAGATGVIDYAHRFAQGTATYGGTVEVFHGIIAQHVLGLPRPGYPGSKVLVSRKRDQAAA